jgi:4-hydroxy-4-methyl-2-oxoglutarate aldolase
MPLGFQVFEEISRPERAEVEAIGSHFSADLADAMQKAGAMSRAIQPVYRPMPKFFGPAVTASLPTGSFSMAKLAMLQCQPGDVLVLNAYEDVSHALLGGHIGRALKVRGIAGVIVDGAIRDSSELKGAELPVCARGTAVVVGGHDGPGEINVPIACGGVVVNPGDIVVADEDGVVVIPRDCAHQVHEATESLHQRHLASGSAYDRGEIPGMDDVEKRIRAAGCEFLSGT